MKHLGSRFAVLWLCLLLGAGSKVFAEAPARDPAVTRVLEMLGSGVSQPVIFRWVSAAGNAPKVVSAEDVIALTRAGASDELLELMIDLAEKAPESLEAVERAPPGAAVSETAAPAPASAATGPAATRFEISYRPKFAASSPEPWDLYVYLDGEPLTWVSKGGQLKESSPVRFTRELAAGQHVLRLMVENHERRSQNRWLHEARVAPVEVVFQLAPGSPAEVEARVAQPRLGLGGFSGADKGPINVEIRQSGKVLATFTDAGGGMADWPELCEEIEVNLDPAKKIPGRVEKALDRCVRWSALWRGLGREVPSREEARARLERYDYRLLAK